MPVAPKTPGRALDEPVQVDADGMALLARVADHEVAVLVRVAEDLGDVAAGGQADRGVVRRHGLDRQRARLFFGVFLRPGGVFRRVRFGAALQHQGRQDLQVGVERLAVQGLGQGGRQARLALLIREARVGGAELQVGHQPVELPVAARDDHEGPFLDFLGRHGQPGAQDFPSIHRQRYNQWVSSYHSYFSPQNKLEENFEIRF